MDKFEQAIGNFGALVRDLREKQGSTQEDFAHRVGIDRSYYGRIERGDANPTLRNIIAIADGLGLHVCDLFPRRGQRNK